jgi:malate dehydrogenase
MKITIIGAGNVGGLAAMRIAEKELGEVLLIDIVPGLAKGKAYDLEDCRQIFPSNYAIQGTDDLNQLKGSGIIVVTAGLARKPGMTREDLLNKNSQILKDICAKIKISAPQAIVIIVTNPLDTMTYYAQKILGFKANRVFGMGATLDSSRFANLISESLKVSPTEIQPVVVGSHGEAMLPLPRFTLVKDKPLTEIAGAQEIEVLVKKTIERGKEIVSLLGSGSAYFAPSAAIAQLVEAVAKNRKITLGVSAFLSGEYGLKDISIGVPCCLGEAGVEKIITLDLSPEEKKAFLLSAESVRQLNSYLSF